MEAAELAPYRDALAVRGFSVVLDCGAKVLVQAVHYQPLMEHIRMTGCRFTCRHVFLDPSLEDVVSSLVASLPKRLKVKALSSDTVPLSFATTCAEMPGAVSIHKTFIDVQVPSSLLSSGESGAVTASTTEADLRKGRNPRITSRSACAAKHHQHVRRLQEKADADVVATAILDAVLCCGRFGLDPSFRMQRKEPVTTPMLSEYWSRPDSLAFTIGLGAALLRDQIACQLVAFDGTFRLHLLGCRWHVEGTMDFQKLLKLMIHVLSGICRITCLKVGLLGPEMLGRDHIAEASFRKAMEMSGSQLKIQVSTRRYHDSPPPAANLALVLNGGIDSSFGAWAPTLQLLLEHRTPTAFTGYAPYDKLGCERVLRLMKSAVQVPTLSNPFRFNMGTLASDAFVVCTCGVEDGQPVPSSSELEEVHRLERIEKLKDLERLNAEDGNSDAVQNLKSLRLDLERGLELIPPDVTHSDIERWALGQSEARW